MTTIEDAALADTMGAAAPGARGARRFVGPVVVGIALLSAFATFVVLADLTPIVASHYVVIGLLAVNALAILVLLAIIAREIWPVVQARRRGRAGARLHVRIVGLFSVIAAAPAIMVAIVASVTLDRGLDRLLSTRDLITNTKDVAEIYGLEHVRALRGDTLAMAISLSQARPLFDQDRDRFRQVFSAQASLRGLPAAMLINSERNVLVKSEFNPQLELAIPPAGAFARINDTEPQIEPVPDTNYLVAIIKMRGYDDTFLYVARPLDARVVQLGSKAIATLGVYDDLQARRLGLQIAFALMFAVIALTVLLSAVWIGLNFANLLVAPIRRLIGAANNVSAGNLYVQVPVHPSEGDLAHLGETFNNMTQELRTQR
ncbi:MAG: two-component system, NtrC family, nitrogen regulation sensor histidine kinase NtrY, partial [Alphaproteobacteria bacterium]|nr:two-component system, NtrC family, nitrogen regulation sensor histidine kinase NtrY [Alphaproteobacteria bacterium]